MGKKNIKNYFTQDCIQLRINDRLPIVLSLVYPEYCGKLGGLFLNFADLLTLAKWQPRGKTSSLIRSSVYVIVNQNSFLIAFQIT